MERNVSITYSNGLGKSGKQYAFIRPALRCFNRSRRVLVQDIERTITKHFPEVHYYSIDGRVIGAKNPQFALREYWRVCDKSKIGVDFPVTEILYLHK